MGTLLSRLLALVCATAALFFGARALILFLALISGPVNFLPGSRGDVPGRTLFSGETEQVLIILISLIVIAMAWLLWRKPRPTSE
jgi:hypothetical protein